MSAAWLIVELEADYPSRAPAASAKAEVTLGWRHRSSARCCSKRPPADLSRDSEWARHHWDASTRQRRRSVILKGAPSATGLSRAAAAMVEAAERYPGDKGVAQLTPARHSAVVGEQRQLLLRAWHARSRAKTAWRSTAAFDNARAALAAGMRLAAAQNVCRLRAGVAHRALVARAAHRFGRRGVKYRCADDQRDYCGF
jgi:hypothetical protein